MTNLEHSIGILDNIVMLIDGGYSADEVRVACLKQKVELLRQSNELDKDKP